MVVIVVVVVVVVPGQDRLGPALADSTFFLLWDLDEGVLHGELLALLTARVAPETDGAAPRRP